MRHFFARAEPKAHATRPRRCECRRQALRSQALEASGPPCPKHLQLPAHHTPKRLRHPAHRAQALAGLGLSAPGTFGFHTAVRQSPTVCHTPRLLAHVVSHAIACNATWFRTVFNPAPRAPTASSPPRPKRLQHPAHRLPHNARPCTRGFPRSCVRCNLVPHGFPHSAPGICGMLNAMLPRPYGFPGSTPDARYLFGATLSSSQVHRKAKATRTRTPPA